LVPRVRVGRPNIHLLFEPAGIIQARGSERGILRGRVGPDENRRATVRAKAAVGLAATITQRVMEARRALHDFESFRRHDDIRRKRPATGSLAIATVTVKH
jgi:hypothetical protein